MKAICPVCSKTYSRSPSEMRKCGLTCSRKCRAVLQKRSKVKICKTCGKGFEARKSQINKGYGKYCSKRCFTKTLKTRERFRCVICDSEFERTPYQVSKGYTKFCSRKCVDISKRKFGTSGGGRENLFAPWQRREWLGDKCIECGSTERLELDHIIPRYSGGLAIRENAQTLCLPCNRKKYHDGRDYYLWLACRSIFNRT